MPREVRQGEVWSINFGEPYPRAAIVISRDMLNKGDTALVVPCFGRHVEERVRHPNYVFLAEGTGGLREDSAAATHLLQAVELGYFVEHWGRLLDDDLGRVLNGLAWTVDLYDLAPSQ